MWTHTIYQNMGQTEIILKVCYLLFRKIFVYDFVFVILQKQSLKASKKKS